MDGDNRVVVVLSSGILVTSQSFESADEARAYFEAFNRRPPSAKRIKIRGEKPSFYLELLDGKRKKVVAKSELFKSLKKAESVLAEFIELISTSAVQEGIPEPEEEQLVIQEQDVKDASKYSYRIEIYPKKDNGGTVLTSRITNIRTERTKSFNGINGKDIEEFISKDLPQSKLEKVGKEKDLQVTEKEKNIQKKTPTLPKASFGIVTMVDGNPAKILPRQANASLKLQLLSAHSEPELEVGVRLVQRQPEYDVPYYSFIEKVSAAQQNDLTIGLPKIDQRGLYRLEVSVSGATEIAYVQVA
jgi:hypothetical protein